MSSYYPSFNYLGINSREKNLVVAHFDSDSGEVDTYLGMEPIYTESADGTSRIDYGAKYNNVATIKLSVIKQDGGDFSVADVRDCLKWLTGARQNSALDLTEHFLEEFTANGVKTSFELEQQCDNVYYVQINGVSQSSNAWSYDSNSNAIKFTTAPTKGKLIKIAYNKIRYSFIGRITNAWQQKMDARTTGLVLEFTSISPWAYSPIHTVTSTIGSKTKFTIQCDSDDLYGYVYPKVEFTKTGSKGAVKIENRETGDVGDKATTINNVALNEVITIQDNMMITSDKTSRVFGADFNFVFPRLKSGTNTITVTGQGSVTFIYRTPIKVGDCAMDISVMSDPICNEDGEIIEGELDKLINMLIEYDQKLKMEKLAQTEV